LSNKKRILVIASTTGYQTRAFAEAADELGYDVQLATDRCHVLEDPWGDQALALRFEHPETAAEVVADFECITRRFDGLVAVGDRPAEIAASVARRLGLPFSSPGSVQACRNKYLARERFGAAGLNVPEYRRIAIEDGAHSFAAAVLYPCILKPLGLSGSRGVIRANDSEDFVAAFERIRRILASPDVVRMDAEQDQFLQLEDYIDGEEFALEGLLTHGELQTIALFDKPDPLTGPYFEETIYVTPSRALPDVQQAIVDTVLVAAAALGLVHGPIHAEMRVNTQGVWVLEIAARPIGGLCARALRFESGLTLEHVVLQHAAGDPIATLRLNKPARGVMMIPIPRAGVLTSVDHVEPALNTPGIEDVVITAKEGQKLVPLPEGSSYLGFIFASGASPAEVEASLRTAHTQLKFEILEALSVLR